MLALLPRRDFSRHAYACFAPFAVHATCRRRRCRRHCAMPQPAATGAARRQPACRRRHAEVRRRHHSQTGAPRLPLPGQP